MKREDVKKVKARTKSAVRALRMERAAISSLTALAHNPRAHSARNLESIQRSLEKFGQQKPIVVDADGVILAGNGTFAAAQALGWTQLEVVRSNLRGAEAKAYVIADNRAGDLSDWDAEELSRQLKELEIEGFESVDLGFYEGQLEALQKEDFAAAHGFVEPKEKSPADEKEKETAGAGDVAEQYKVVLDCRDEAHQTAIMDAIESAPESLPDLLRGIGFRSITA